MQKITTKKIAMAAILAAAAVALDVLSGRTDYIKFTIYSLPLLFAGIFCGPLTGLLTGVVAGFLCQLFSPYGLTITTPLWMVAPVLWSTISALIFNLCFKKQKGSYLSIIVTVVATSLIVTGYNTLATWLDGIIMGYPTPYIIANIDVRILTALGLCVPYCIFIREVYVRVPDNMKYIPLEKKTVETSKAKTTDVVEPVSNDNK